MDVTNAYATVNLTREEKDQLEWIAIQNNTSVQQIIITIIQHYLENYNGNGHRKD